MLTRRDRAAIAAIRLLIVGSYTFGVLAISRGGMTGVEMALATVVVVICLILVVTIGWIVGGRFGD